MMRQMLGEKGASRSRIASGVTVVSIAARPFPCPHGRCIYCPGGESTPQSYVERSPIVMRGSKLGYDPYLQVIHRLQDFSRLGVHPSKVELIVMGGTFNAQPFDYQEWFVKRALDGMNSYMGPEISSRSLLEAQELNETSSVRCVAMTLETRPDLAMEDHVDRMLYLGFTRVELGVQSPFDDVLLTVGRGHTVGDVRRATRVLKDSAYKVGYHLMPGLPGSDLDRDLEALRLILEDPSFKPDMLKIYPTLVIPGTPLYEIWRRGEYAGITDEEFKEYLMKAIPMLPRWMRLQHVQRDIPEEFIASGPRRRNLRQMVEEALVSRGVKVNEMRFREVGRVSHKGMEPDYDSVRMEVIEYEASGGTEFFLSLVDRNDVLMAILRLRDPSPLAHRWEVDGRTSLIRELHVYGHMVPIGERPGLQAQHRGYGTMLVREAERISLEEIGARRILVISGIGARDYFRKLGYGRITGSFYLGKELSS
ncbi:MAG: tRNA uridine(34) 5-carboxymethylaminomethyl modification radical SAM/GNAT enzyme Elp3 [Candidatus Korarchaeum sp.]